MWLTILIGIVGVLVGNVIASTLGVRHIGGVDWIRHILQVRVAVGLVILITPIWLACRSRSG